MASTEIATALLADIQAAHVSEETTPNASGDVIVYCLITWH